MLPLLLLALLVAGCADDAPGTDRGPAVVATTTQATDLARWVMCRDRKRSLCAVGEPVGLLDAKADPHDYELRPEDVERLAEADLVIRSGGETDEWLDEALESSGSDAPVVTLLDAAGGEDPHWWTDPRAAQRAVGAIRDALAEADPERAGIYRDAAAAYLQRLQRLDRDIEACVREVPRSRRKVVTTHDALGRFAERYGIEIVGTVIPSRSTQAQTSSGQVSRLVGAIRAAGATTVFSEATVPQDVERAIADQAGARLGRPLRIDSLGELGYVEATALNARALVDGMGGGKAACSLPL